jgi:hypothetical protein
MPDESNTNDAQLEEIVAYLDGALPAEDAARVEQRLGADEAYRRQLQSIERAWSALDELPQTTVDDKFSRTTMQLAVQAATDEWLERTTALPIVRRRRRLSTVLAAVTAAALGFLAFRLAWHDPNAPLLADLPVIDNVDVYSQIENVAFLRSLDKALGAELQQLGAESPDVTARLARFDAVRPAAQRDRWVRALPDDQRTNLLAKFNRFSELPPAEQDAMRRLHAELVAAPDAAQLQRTMLLYHEWLGGVPPAQQFELRTMPTPERVRTIGAWMERMREQTLLALSREELEAFRRAMRQPLEELKHSARELIDGPDKRRQPSRVGGGGGGGPPNVDQLRRALTIHFAAGVARPGKFQEAVIAALPERAREPFDSLSPRDKIDQFMTWMRQGEALGGEVSEAQLEEFFANELDAQTRAELLSLPPDEMEQALRRRYRRQPGPGFGGPWGARDDRHDHDGPGGPGPGGPRRDDRGPPPDRDHSRGFGPPRHEGDRPRPDFGPPPRESQS